jgi:hypothetical protein
LHTPLTIEYYVDTLRIIYISKPIKLLIVLNKYETSYDGQIKKIKYESTATNNYQSPILEVLFVFLTRIRKLISDVWDILASKLHIFAFFIKPLMFCDEVQAYYNSYVL